MIRQIISGGQTGVDRAALNTARQFNIPIGGWCPKNRWAEDGPIPDDFPLRETPSKAPKQRTEWNVKESDGTLIISSLPLRGGTAYTHQVAQILKKPWLVADWHQSISTNTSTIINWLNKENIKVLNIAGPRKSEEQQAYKHTSALLNNVFHQLGL
jgi:hypothetical protein